MRVFLSQIKEWHTEIAADMVFIVVRTDCAWYKVRSVLPAYEGWFRPILKVSSVAAHLLGTISDASRSSKLSFQDIVNSLSALKVEDSPSIYVSRKKDQVLEAHYHTLNCSALSCW
jgi:Cytosine specific DNA methyltransferase replication foci domain